jgi:hypothetical protein
VEVKVEARWVIELAVREEVQVTEVVWVEEEVGARRPIPTIPVNPGEKGKTG